MGCIDYKKLYKLQDRVLDVIFSVENEFYLTGGTCLGRFYHEKRYSDDLDLFTNSSSRYSFAVKNIKMALNKEFNVDVEVEVKDFTRFKVDNLLQLDFVNDIASRYKDVIVIDNHFPSINKSANLSLPDLKPVAVSYLIDNIENILSNKLTAIIGRDNPKDIFDIYLIAKFYSFSWHDILAAAHNKTGFCDEDLSVRLKSFPMDLLKKINIIDTTFLDNIEEDFPIIIEEINQKQEHQRIDLCG